MNAPCVLVLGGSGFVGRQVCEQLARLGWHITVPTRRAVNAARVQSLPGLTVIEANVHQEADLARLIPGHDAVVNLVAVLHGSEERFESVHVNLPGKIASAMKKAGVQRLVHISALGADPQGPSMYQRSKARGETVLHNAGLQLTVLRPSVIFGAEDKFLNLFADLQAVAPFMPLAGSGTRFAPVWVGDVARAVVVCLQKLDTVGQTYELCGPDVMTLGELVHRAGQWAGVNEGRGRPVIGLPMWVGWLQAAAMELAPGEPLMSRDNLASMKVDNIATGQLPRLPALGISASSAAGVAPGYLGHRGPRSKLNRWRAGAGR
ncbi:complex I NDUFA9 subunit family protein [Limnohabitans sp. 63ED37-2]|uniref:complex I NDUFA9 subunit family protein n=1 Tax=Limnohabitans sp. 63ED37-2 TaxID=1678128 RepID=UPI000706DF88|nr:complex I NDUFA9 subunit family protein [Limnohabitans sp. 63ED37-2]ALK87600.1 NAD dependent epimerase/dehydratase family protein [Limnohabitans sp. 63ED37-2]